MARAAVLVRDQVTTLTLVNPVTDQISLVGQAVAPQTKDAWMVRVNSAFRVKTPVVIYAAVRPRNAFYFKQGKDTVALIALQGNLCARITAVLSPTQKRSVEFLLMKSRPITNVYSWMIVLRGHPAAINAAKTRWCVTTGLRCV